MRKLSEKQAWLKIAEAYERSQENVHYEGDDRPCTASGLCHAVGSLLDKDLISKDTSTRMFDKIKRAVRRKHPYYESEWLFRSRDDRQHRADWARRAAKRIR